MVTLPTPIPSTSGWQMTDFLRLRLRSSPAYAGQAVLDAGQLDSDVLWMIDHTVVSCDSLTRTVLRFYESAADPTRYLSGSNTGNFDEADYPGGLQVAPATSLVAVWSGASDGARGLLALQGRVYRRA